MKGQAEKWLGDPILHGHYEPDGHAGRTYTFWNNGEFTSIDHPNCLEVRRYGAGFYKLEGKNLRLVFTANANEQENMQEETPHEEEYRISLKGNNTYEISRFTIRSKEKTRAKLVWKRSPGELPYRERVSSDQPRIQE